jgi:hypothetical protein
MSPWQHAGVVDAVWSRACLVFCFAVAAIALNPAGANAATIVVNATHDLTGSFDDPGGCNLRDAITAANTNAPFDECPGDNGGGTGADTIVLQPGQTYKLTNHQTPENANASGDLDITGGGGTRIRSDGAGLATIDADSTIFPGPADNTRGRAIEVLAGAGAVTLERILVTGGGVTDSTGGGGIRALAPLTLIDSEVSGNNVGLLGGAANFGGGGILIRSGGSLTLTGSTIADNVVEANSSQPSDSAPGGGISYFASGGPLNVTNSTISGNRVDAAGGTNDLTEGGGIFWFGSSHPMNLTNVTIANNSAVGAGAGASVTGGGIALSSPDARLRGTILSGNQASDDADCSQNAPSDDLISAGDNVFGDTAACDPAGGSNDIELVLPKLSSLSNFGGPTRTHLPNSGSPAINHGGACPATDQRGFFRVPVAPCDAGAVEVGAPAVLPPPEPPPPVVPSNEITFGKVTRDKKKGTATLAVSVPGAGELALAGDGLKPSSAIAAAAGDVTLEVKATGKAKQKLRRKGKKTFEPSVTFTPAGGAPNTESTSVKLVRK